MKQPKVHIAKESIIDSYMDTVVERSNTLFDVEEFCCIHNLTTEEFYDHFEDFEELNKLIFRVFIDNSIAVLSETVGFDHFSKKDKLLSLYYTLFESLTLNRAFVLLTIRSYGLNLNALPLLGELKKSFVSFIDSLEMETLSLSSALESIQKKSLQEGLWIQFLLTFKFWMTDDSEDCEKTDIFIEKSVNTGIELLNTKSLNNIIDLGKFLYAEKVKSKGS